MIDLSALDSALAPATAPAAEAMSNGKPLEIPLTAIDEDPDQPRKEFSDEALADMVASILATGVRTPVSVRSHPTDEGRYTLNYGARRYRASKAAGRKTIPAFVDEGHNDYDQVIENLQREDLTPMELALFIKRKLDEGSKPTEIAKRLGKQKAVITYHQALIDPPAVIEQAYASARCTSPRTLYELRNLYDKHPKDVEAWAASTPEISRASIAALADGLKPIKKPTSGLSVIAGESGLASSAADKEGAQKPAGAIPGAGSGQGVVKRSESASDAGSATASVIACPVLTVDYEGQMATVLLDRRPSDAGLIKIRFEDGAEAEVAGGRCRITGLSELGEVPV